MQDRFGKLDNVVWHSLIDCHGDFAIDLGDLKCYEPSYGPFAGFTGENDLTTAVDKYAALVDDFFIVGEKPQYNGKIKLKEELVCLQMVCESKIDHDISNTIISLNNVYEKELFEFMSFAYPGYFRSKTVKLGPYHGIFDNGKLVAVTGERMKMKEFTEVSAIVTHPECTGRGYAQELVTKVVNDIFDEGEIPFLHVNAKNERAIRLYEHLGFRVRRKMSFWNFVSS